MATSQSAVLGYFDTSALMRWAENDVASPQPLNARIGPEVARLVAGDGRLGLSELTLVEYRAAVSYDLRRQDAQCAALDIAWALRVREELMRLVASRRVEVVPVPSHAFEHAMTLVDMAAGEHQMRLGTWDAIHLITACAWAQREGSRVTLYTSDHDFDEFVDAYPHFRTFADIVNLDNATQT